MGEPHVEYGVQLPNGDIRWGSYLGHSLATEEDRGAFFLGLYKTAEQLGFRAEEFMNRFHWVTRTIIGDDARYVMDDPAMVPSVEAPKRPPKEPLGPKDDASSYA